MSITEQRGHKAQCNVAMPLCGFQLLLLTKFHNVIKCDITWSHLQSFASYPIEFASRKPEMKITNGNHMTARCCDVVIVKTTCSTYSAPLLVLTVTE